MDAPSPQQSLSDTLERFPDDPVAKERMREWKKLPVKERTKIKAARIKWKQEQKRLEKRGR